MGPHRPRQQRDRPAQGHQQPPLQPLDRPRQRRLRDPEPRRLGARDPGKGEKAVADTGARFVRLDVTGPVPRTALNAVTGASRQGRTPHQINSAYPGWCATDLSHHLGPRTAAQGATTAVRLATLGDDGPTGGFYDDDGVVAW